MDRRLEGLDGVDIRFSEVWIHIHIAGLEGGESSLWIVHEFDIDRVNLGLVAGPVWVLNKRHVITRHPFLDHVGTCRSRWLVDLRVLCQIGRYLSQDMFRQKTAGDTLTTYSEQKLPAGIGRCEVKYGRL